MLSASEKREESEIEDRSSQGNESDFKGSNSCSKTRNSSVIVTDLFIRFIVRHASLKISLSVVQV